jgi:hypothetical protein
VTIRAALDKLVILEKALSITSPVTLAVKEAFKYIPPQTHNVVETPVWMNAWQLNDMSWLPGNQRMSSYSINMRLAAISAMVEQDRGADIATAFWEALIKALRNDVKLGGTIDQHKLRSQGPTLVVMEFGGKAYIGLDVWLDIDVIETNA